jgi:hypothetical protein
MRFRIEEYTPGRYRVSIKKWYTFWYSGFIHTDFFSVGYKSLEEATKAITQYKNRFTEIKD